MVGLAKKEMARQITVGQVLNFDQLEAVILRIAAILNERPLSARTFSEEEFYSVTPKDLLLGAAPISSPEEALERIGQEVSADRLQRMLEVVEEKVQAWWIAFFQDVFPLLVTRKKMMREYRNLELGDIVLL